MENSHTVVHFVRLYRDPSQNNPKLLQGAKKKKVENPNNYSTLEHWAMNAPRTRTGVTPVKKHPNLATKEWKLREK